MTAAPLDDALAHLRAAVALAEDALAEREADSGLTTQFAAAGDVFAARAALIRETSSGSAHARGQRLAAALAPLSEGLAPTPDPDAVALFGDDVTS